MVKMGSIGVRVKKIRKQVGLTQKKFSQKLGVYQSHISQIESGRAEPSGQLINLICRTFGVNEEWLKNEKGPISWDTDLNLKEIFEFKEYADKKAGNGIITLLSAYTTMLDKINQRIVDLHFIDISIDYTDTQLLAAKEEMELAIEMLKRSIEVLFKQNEN